VPPEPIPLQALRLKLESYLPDLFGAYRVDQSRVYSVEIGEAVVYVSPKPWTDESAVVTLFTYTNEEVAVSYETLAKLNALNSRLTFGNYVLDERARFVAFEHALLGDYLDPEELRAAVYAVAGGAFFYAEEIRDVAGGRLWTET
jgi:Putative bacterial sensory transduction regulator